MNNQTKFEQNWSRILGVARSTLAAGADDMQNMSVNQRATLAEQQWEDDPAIRTEFRNKETWLAYAKRVTSESAMGGPVKKITYNPFQGK